MQQPLQRRLHAGDGVQQFFSNTRDELAGTAVFDVADVDVIAQEQEERFVADEFFRLVDGMAETLRGCAARRSEPLAERAEFFRFRGSPSPCRGRP